MGMVSSVRVQKTILGIVLVGSLGAIVSGDDQIFPFSNYPMYARTFSPLERALFWTVMAEFEDGSVRRFDTIVGGEAGLKPFWGASFREALLVEKDVGTIAKKLKATVDWQRDQAKKSGLSASRTVKKLTLYKHQIPWPSMVERRLRDESLRPLFLENAEIVAEAQ